MNEIVFRTVTSKFNDKYLICFESGHFWKPIFILDKNEIKRLKEEIKNFESERAKVNNEKRT